MNPQAMLRATVQQQRIAEREDQRSSDQQAKHTFLEVRIEMASPGEAIAELTFPVVFLEEPRFGFGTRLLPNQSLVSANFPKGWATVDDYELRDKSDSRRFWVGARVALVLEAPAETGVYFDCVFRGKCIRNPAFGSSDVGGVL